MSHYSVRITEIFYSLQGESVTVGLPTIFIRLTGCPLRCVWCDTAYAFQGGQLFTYEQIIQTISKYPTKLITITGGEPLAQKNCRSLMNDLLDHGYQIFLETSGALPLDGLDQRVIKVMDLKAPGSGEVHRNLYDNIYLLNTQDQIKMVIADKADFDWAVSQVILYSLESKVDNIFISPVYDKVNLADLAQWILDSKLRLRLQVQLHKIIWGDKPGV